MNLKALKILTSSKEIHQGWDEKFQEMEGIVEMGGGSSGNQGFPNSIKGWGNPPSGRGMGKFAGGNFFIRYWEPGEE